MSTWREIENTPTRKRRVSPDGIRITETLQADGLWHSLREYPDGRRYEATDHARTAATKQTQRMANR